MSYTWSSYANRFAINRVSQYLLHLEGLSLKYKGYDGFKKNMPVSILWDEQYDI